jgi:predicted DNA-binding transcriptional regulator AlpA
MATSTPTSTPASPGQWLRLAQVCQKTATGKTWVYDRMKDACDPFPASVRIAPRLVVWDAAAVDAWMARRLATMATAPAT